MRASRNYKAIKARRFPEVTMTSIAQVILTLLSPYNRLHVRFTPMGYVDIILLSKANTNG